VKLPNHRAPQEHVAVSRRCAVTTLQLLLPSTLACGAISGTVLTFPLVSITLPIILYLVSVCYCHVNRVDYLNGRNIVGHVACMEEKRNAYELLVSKTVGKRSLETKSANTGFPRNGVCVCVDWTQVANNRHQ